eukprot:gnl/Dysnectes_brevis/5369_a7686_584.p1 GENE.gnl/Dysnectes_brevis/5369_a7686_584~~gnl/Dysnectes_brevis/5369_a7686_584.p1  ORF type:complete len:463 (+),score=73.01 gnl/Dysnectes_brevis/5369_a7686_584:186-1574(+)
MMSYLLLSLCLAVTLAYNPFVSVTSLDQLVPGDPYDLRLPEIVYDLSRATVAIVLGDKTEDVEGFYPLNYFLDRNAEVVTICPDTATLYDNQVFVNDFTKPTYSVTCDLIASELSKEDWLAFDAVVVVGGAGVYFIRDDPALIRGLQHYYHHAGEDRVLAPICAGGETAIDFGLVDANVTCSPTSADELESAGYIWTGNLVEWYLGNSRQATVVMGLDPTAHYTWTTRIGWVLNGRKGSPSVETLSEIVATPRAQWESLYSISQLTADEEARSWAFPRHFPPSTDLRVGIIMARGGANLHSEYPWQCLGDYCNTQLICPGWSFPAVQLDSAQRPSSLAQCDVALESADGSDYDLLIVTGGQWGATVLRSGDERDQLATLLASTDALILAMGEGVEAVQAAGLALGEEVCGGPRSASNLFYGGSVVADVTSCQITSTDRLITARGDDFNSHVLALDLALEMLA